MTDNPYATPKEFAINPTTTEGAELIRQTNLQHEASVKSVGSLYLLGAAICLVPGIGMVAAGFMDRTREMLETILLGVFYLALAVLYGVIGKAIRNLRPWSRIAAIVLSAIGLIGFPLGTIISGYILYLMVCAKGQLVFTPEYKSVIEQTPHMKYKTSKLVIILLLVLVAVFLLVIGLAIFSA